MHAHFIQHQPPAHMTYALLHTFLSMLAQQLTHFSSSVYFTVDNLAYAGGGVPCVVRSSLLRCMLQAVAAQATESCRAAAASQHASVQGQGAPGAGGSSGSGGPPSGAVSSAEMAARGGGVVQW